MAQIKVTLMRNGSPAENAHLVYGNKSKYSDENGVILWPSVASDYAEVIPFAVIFSDGVEGLGGTKLIQAGDDIELGG